MKTLISKIIIGVVLGTATVGTCVIGVNKILNVDHNKINNSYEKQALSVNRTTALIEAEEDVRETNAKVDIANEELKKKTEAKETAVKNLETAQEAVKQAEEKKKTTENEFEKAVETKNEAEATVKKAEEAKRLAEEQIQSAKTDEERKIAEEAKRLALEEAKKAEEERQAALEKVVAAQAEAKRAAEEERKALEEAKKAETAKKLAEEEAKNAEEAKKLAEEQARKAEEVRQAALEEAQRLEEAKKAEEEAKKAEEARKAAEAEAQRLEEERKAAEEAKNIEEAKRLAEEANKKAEEARLAQEEENRKTAEAKKAEEEARNAQAQREAAEEARRIEKEKLAKEALEKTTPTTQANSTPSTTENSSPSESKTTSTEDIVATIKNAVDNTVGATSLTVRNVKENWTKMYDKNSGTELIVYHNGANDGSSIPSGVLYSYTDKSNINAKQVSLFKAASSSPWTIPNVKGSTGWDMQFSGKRTVGVIELELVKNLRFLIDATPLTTNSLKGTAYNDIGSSVKFYRVAISNSSFNSWLSEYYYDSVATDTVMIDIGISNDYVSYLKGTVLGNNKTRNFEIVLVNANMTQVPTASELGITDVSALEEEYKSHYGCKKTWDKDKNGNDYYYWTCDPNRSA